MRTSMKWWMAGAMVLAACSGSSGPKLEDGATSFVTEEPGSSGPTRGGFDGEQAPTAGAANEDANKGAPMGRTGTVEEADIYRVDNNRLFYFNTYRGFIIYDLTNPQSPQKVSRLPVYGYPVEMYVDGNTVYALLRDSLYLTQEAGGQKFQRHDTSQLVTIDVSDLANPKVLKTIDIVGQLREGVSRKIDDTIYVVSYIPQGYYGWWFWDWGWYGQIDTDKEQAWVYSFNIADAQNPQLVDKLQIFEGGGSNNYGNTGGTSRYFQGVAISATSNTLHVVENWQTYGYVQGSPYSCGSSFSLQQAAVSIVDISNPSGAIRLHTKFETYGHLNDQFKQTYIYDEATQHGYYYGIFNRREWASANCSGSNFLQNTFEVWDITDGSAPTRVGSLKFGKPNETVRGSTFDPGRKVAFAITAQQIDPLYAIDYTVPSNPKIASEIDGLSGDMNVFRFIGGENKFLMGIGRDNSDSCTGFAPNSTNWRTGQAVSIIDVRDLNAIRLVQRRCIDIPDAQWVSSDVNWNLDQAHKMIGMGSDRGVNVVTVPVSYYKRTDESFWWWYRYSSAVGMLTWDLAKYDPSKSELEQNVLTTHGSVEHGHGNVRRTIVFTHTGADPAGAQDDRRMLLNLSDTYLSLYDIENVDAPVQKAEVEIAPDVEEIFRYGNYLVEHVREEGFNYGYDTPSEFRVKATGGTIDETATSARFTVGQVQRVMKWKDALVIFRRKAQDPSISNGPYYNQETSQIIVYDLTNPAAPVLKSVTDLGYSIYPYYRFYCGLDVGYFGGYWWGNGSDWVSFDGGLAFRLFGYDYQSNTSQTKLVYVNLSDLAAPAIKTHDLSSSGRDVLALTADATDPGGFFLTYRDRISSSTSWFSNQMLVQYKYYAQRWTSSGDDIEADAATNVPGQIVRSWRSGDKTLLLTQDSVYTWIADPNNFGNGYYEGDPRLHLLERLDDSTAAWRGSHLFDDRSLGSLVGEGDKVYVTSQHAYRYVYGSNTSTNMNTEDRSDRLAIFDTSALSLSPAFDASIGLQSFSAMGASGNRLFLNVPSAGVLVLDTANAAAPVGRSFLRTLGWGSHLEFAGTTLYVAAGHFGVFQRNLLNLVLAAP